MQEEAAIADDEGDPAAACRGVREGGVVGHHPELVGVDLDLPQVNRADRAVLDRNLVLLAGAIVGDRQRIGHATQRLPRRLRPRAPASPGCGNPPKTSVRDRQACSVRCRTAARPDRPDGGGSTRTQDRAAPCATRLLYLAGGVDWRGPIADFRFLDCRLTIETCALRIGLDDSRLK